MTPAILHALVISVSLFCAYDNTQPGIKTPVHNVKKTNISVSKAKSFDEQLAIFTTLGYRLNDSITKELIFAEMMESDASKRLKNPDSLFAAEPMTLLYYYLGWTHRYNYYYTNDCIWYDVDFIDPSEEYIHLMQRMGLITHGEITYTDIELSVDEDGYEWIHFTANGMYKKWKLEKEGFIDESIFNRFGDLTKELKTKGRYTYFDDGGGQQFVLDYATEQEQKNFIKKTGLKREWLGEGSQFAKPRD